MRSIHSVGVLIVAATAITTTAVCQTKVKQEPLPTGHDHLVSVARAERPTIEEAITAARTWLDALKAKDNARIVEWTRLPFAYATTDKRKVCDRTAADVKKIADLVECLWKRDKLLIAELVQAGKLPMKIIERGQIPSSLIKLIGAQAAGERLVSTFINGDGITFEIVLIVAQWGANSAAGVKAFFVNAEFESG